MTVKTFLFLLVSCLACSLALPAHAQKNAKDQTAKEEASAEKGRAPVSIFKKADDNAQASPAGDARAKHQEAKKEVRLAKRERKAAQAREDAARARAEALKAQRRAVGAENRSDRVETRAEKGRIKAGKQ